VSDSNRTGTPADGVAYDNTADPVWARKALDLYQDHRLQVAAFDTEGVISAQVWGPCPRCDHDLNVQSTLNAPIPGLRQGRGLWATLTGQAPPGGAGIPSTVEVGCGCGHAHREAPENTLGCGVSFRLPTTPLGPPVVPANPRKPQ
jgi:hypothetical protein